MNTQESAIDAIATDLLNTWVERRKERLSKYKDTGNLVQSLGWQARQVAGAALSYGIAFDISGRYIDMKRSPSRGIGREQIEALKEWAKRHIDKLRRGYERRTGRVATDMRIINDVAWGIATKQTDKYSRPRRWYAKTSSGLLDDLFDQIAGAMLDTVADDIKTATR